MQAGSRVAPEGPTRMGVLPEQLAAEGDCAQWSGWGAKAMVGGGGAGLARIHLQAEVILQTRRELPREAGGPRAG